MNKKNLANAQLLNSITTAATTITVKANQGEALPATPFFATLTPLGVLSTIDNSEIVQVTARTGDVLTVTRAQRGTTAKEFQAESILANSVYVEDTIPTGGTNGQVLKRNATGDAIWSTDTDTTYTEITEAEIDAGTASTLRTMTGRRAEYMQGKKFDKAGGTISGDVEVTGKLTKSGAKVATLDANDELPGNQVDYSKRYTCILRRNTNQSIPNATVTAIQFNTAALLDPYGWHSPTVQNSRVTVNKTGLYRFIGYVQWFDGGGGYRIASIRVNGGTGPVSHRAAPDSGGRASNSFTFYHQLNAGEFVELLVNHSSGATLNMTNAHLEVTLMD